MCFIGLPQLSQNTDVSFFFAEFLLAFVVFRTSLFDVDLVLELVEAVSSNDLTASLTSVQTFCLKAALNPSPTIPISPVNTTATATPFPHSPVPTSTWKSLGSPLMTMVIAFLVEESVLRAPPFFACTICLVSSEDSSCLTSENPSA